MLSPVDRYVRVGGINTRYWQMGETGEEIVLLHGGTGSIEFWVYNIPTLAEHHRVYAFDTIGTGRTSPDPDSDYSLAAQAKFLGEFMDVFNISRAVLVGNSMGGGAALQFALLNPDRVAKLVLVDTMGCGKEISFGIRLSTLPYIIESSQPGRWMMPPMLRSNFYDPRTISPEWVELRYQIFALPHRQAPIRKLVRTNFNLWGVRAEIYRPILEHLDRITCPSLVIWGAQDRIIPVKHAYIAAERLPHARLQIFDRCGHHPHLEYSKEFDRLVLNFIAD
jgi:pimeloyl-ACP methyl ester carboxylesterase